VQDAIANDEKYSRLDLNRILNQLSEKMTPEQLAEAQKK
jgi:succinylglutamate desuccinylase